ncbi:MAG: EAL domain-containing protein [gamma proteobacterium endosymbiont of Lamellibrachia anaximandri]|nr:EAL domain-containing protein [gamma proteobacterium endosymbiont of Lamellibrachia anaximandri]
MRPRGYRGLPAFASLSMAGSEGRKNYRFYTSAMNDEVQQRVRIEGELTNALKNREFFLFYQPLIRIHDRKMVGMEALIRWQHPERGLLAPYEFLTVAEETGLINSIGDWVLRQACQDTADLHRDGYGDIIVSVNLAASQFRDALLPKTISEILDEKRVESRWLDLEITESILMENTDQVIKTLRHLKALGVTLSVDDFGTGYSSLSYLKRFPVDRLKVDRSFVQDIPSDRNDVEITAAIIAMSHKLNLQVVAEGVETAEQFEFLQQNVCDICQGYMFSEPVPIDKLRQYLDEQKNS